MTARDALLRRLGGTVAVILLLDLAFLGLKIVNGPEPRSYQITAVLGQAGAGLGVGSDVKVRGVRVGKVLGLTLNENAEAVALIEMLPEPSLPDPSRLGVAVTAKTLLGEKQVELFPAGNSLDPPYLQAGDVLTVDPARYPTEVQDVIAALDPFFAAIDPRDLADLVDTFGSLEGEGDLIGRNLDASAELAEWGASTAATQIDRIGTFANVTQSLADRAPDINRLMRSLPSWVSLLPDRQADIRANLELVRTFSTGFAEFLETNEVLIAEMLAAMDIVGAVLEERADKIAELIFGVYRYAYKLGHHGGNLNDGTEFAWFRALTGGEGVIQDICDQLPIELQEHAPGCVVSETGGSDVDEAAAG